MSTCTVDTVKVIARQVAEAIIGPAFKPRSTLESTLQMIPWKELCAGNFSQPEMAELNLRLDPRSCLGRTALMVHISRTYFPDDFPKTRVAEVRSDFFRRLLLNQWGPLFHKDNLPPESWLAEILMYEEPHAIMVTNGRQFDPLFYVYSDETRCRTDFLRHPAVREFSPWEAITAFWMVSKAYQIQDAQKRLDLLGEAEIICPDTCLVRQFMVEPILSLDKINGENRARLIVRDLCHQSPSVRQLFVLETLFGEEHNAKSTYGPDLWPLLEGHLLRRITNECTG